jgi:nucleotide-binding universal stress UspA family protein
MSPTFASIVVGTDGSQTSKRAVAIAADLARVHGAGLHVVHAYRDPEASSFDEVPAAPPVGPLSMWRAASEAVLADALENPAMNGVDVQVHSVSGGAADVLLRVATQAGADLIVVGNRGMQGARQSSDSVPNTVAHHAPCHVLIAKTT